MMLQCLYFIITTLNDDILHLMIILANKLLNLLVIYSYIFATIVLKTLIFKCSITLLILFAVTKLTIMLEFKIQPCLQCDGF